MSSEKGNVKSNVQNIYHFYKNGGLNGKQIHIHNLCKH